MTPDFRCNLSLQGLRQVVSEMRRRGWQITIRQGEKYENIQKLGHRVCTLLCAYNA
jgi:hypothetical protein